MTNPLAQDLGGVEAFCDAMEREHGYRAKLLPNGSLLHGRDADRYEGWELAVHSAEIAGALRDAERWRALLIDTAVNLRRMKDDEFQDCDHDRLDAVLERLDSAMQQGGGGGDHG